MIFTFNVCKVWPCWCGLVLYAVYQSLPYSHKNTNDLFRKSKSPGLFYITILIITALQSSSVTLLGVYHVAAATVTYISLQIGRDIIQSPFSLSVLCRLLLWDVFWILISFLDHFTSYEFCIHLCAILLQPLVLACLSACLHKAPRCFSPAELAISSQMAFTVLWNAVCNLTITNKIINLHNNGVSMFKNKEMLTSPNDSFAMVLAAGLVLYVIGLLLTSTGSSGRLTFLIYNIGFALLIYMSLWHEMKQEPVTWIVSDVVADYSQMFLLLYWFCCLLLCVPIIFRQHATNRKASTIERKFFHGLILAVYIPGLMMSPGLLYITSLLALAVFILLESIRICDIKPLAAILRDSVAIFMDEKDGGLALTPIYLLVGVSYPLWAKYLLYPPSNRGHNKLSDYSGIISIGIGDTAASVFGSIIGGPRWMESSPKTIAGTTSAVVCQLIFVHLIHSPETALQMLYIVFVVTVTSLFEAFTSHIDNLMLPLTMYALLTL